MLIDKLRAAARHGAWKDPNNPFSRTSSRTTPRPSDVSRAEEGLAQPGRPGSTHSENCATDIENNNAAGSSQSGPKRSETMPSDTSAPGSAVSEHPPVRPFDGNKSEKEDSTVPLSNGNLTNTSETRRRKRPGIQEVMSFRAFGKRRRDEEPEPLDEKEAKKKAKFTKHIPIGTQLRAVLYPQWLTINWLLLLVPVGIAVAQVKSIPAIAVFVINFLAIVPLAGILSYATEEIALRVGETLGGLLNASFGNAVELIVGIIALVKRLVSRQRVTSAS